MPKKKYDEEFVKLILDADRAPPERYVRTLDELIEYLLEENNPPVTNGDRQCP